MPSDISSRYKIFTKRFDRVISCEKLDEVLGPMSRADIQAVDKAWQRFLVATAEGRRSHDSARSDRLDVAVTLLLDQSGSMKGEPMLLAASAIQTAMYELDSLGCSVEVLGFTTRSWRGGWPRRLWKWVLRPKSPGRLCELLHIIYHSGDRAPALPEDAVRSMLRPDLPKENIDGEAVLWAANRLNRKPQRRKLLIVLSDGSPVDDSTQQANGPLYLDEHLRGVLESLSVQGKVEVAGLGIGYDVSGWYPISTQAVATEMASTLPKFIRRLLGLHS